MNDIDIEIRLREQLPRLADLAVGEREPPPPLTEVGPFDAPGRAPWRVAAMAAAVIAVLVAIGVATLGAPWDSRPSVRTRPDASADPSVATEPAGPVAHTLTIVASDFHYDGAHYDVPSGITELTLTSDDGGRHVLVFDQPQFAYVHLAVPGGTSSTKVDFVEGHTYGVFCTLPGHQTAGEYATISVGPPDSHTTIVTPTTVPARS